MRVWMRKSDAMLGVYEEDEYYGACYWYWGHALTVLSYPDPADFIDLGEL